MNQPSVDDKRTEERENLHKILGEMLLNITDQVFNDRDIYIDGYRFINCLFIKCRLITLRGTFEFHSCSLSSCRPIFNHEALKSVQLYFIGDNEYPKALEGFKPIIHTDKKSFSIAIGASF
jgi:hypothetical protein